MATRGEIKQTIIQELEKNGPAPFMSVVEAVVLQYEDVSIGQAMEVLKTLIKDKCAVVYDMEKYQSYIDIKKEGEK